MPNNSVAELTLERALDASLSRDIKHRERLIAVLAESLLPVVMPSISTEGLNAIIPKPGSGAIAISRQDFDLVVTLGTMVGAIAGLVSGAPLVALVECALLIWSYWKLAIDLSEEEVIAARAVKELQATEPKARYPTTSQIVGELSLQGYDVTRSDLEETLFSLGQKRNRYGSKCEIVESIRDGDQIRWGVIAY